MSIILNCFMLKYQSNFLTILSTNAANRMLNYASILSPYGICIFCLTFTVLLLYFSSS